MLSVWDLFGVIDDNMVIQYWSIRSIFWISFLWKQREQGLTSSVAGSGVGVGGVGLAVTSSASTCRFIQTFPSTVHPTNIHSLSCLLTYLSSLLATTVTIPSYPQFLDIIFMWLVWFCFLTSHSLQSPLRFANCLPLTKPNAFFSVAAHLTFLQHLILFKYSGTLRSLLSLAASSASNSG